MVKAFLEHFAAIIGGATIALLVVSVSHEYGYFWIVGRHFQTFLTTSDYFSNAVLWLPIMVFVLYMFLDWDVLLGMRRYAPLGLNWRSIILVLVFVVAPIASFFLSPFHSPYIFLAPLIILWLMYGQRVLPFADAESDALKLVRRALIVVPVVMAVLFGFGFRTV